MGNPDGAAPAAAAPVKQQAPTVPPLPLKRKTGVVKRSRRRLSSSGQQSQVTFCVTECKYDCVKEAAGQRGWRLVDCPPPSSAGANSSSGSMQSGGSNTSGASSSSTAADGRANVHWVDISAINERLRELAPWQRINHFPGVFSCAICFNNVSLPESTSVFSKACKCRHQLQRMG
jgi:hypothetical protein